MEWDCISAQQFIVKHLHFGPTTYRMTLWETPVDSET